MPIREYPDGGRLEVDELHGQLADIELGPGVQLKAGRLDVGQQVRIGTLDDEDAFRFPGGTRIAVDALRLGDRVRIGRHVLMRGGHLDFERDCRIGHATTVKVNRSLRIGAHGIVNEQCEIAGIEIDIGRELWMLPTAKIGGGSAFEVHSRLRAGHWLHLGMRTLLNTARPIELGDEVGLGTGTSLYTHGAYPSALDGKPAGFGPIAVGDRTWIPGAIVNPSVTIGADCVIGVGSVVTRSIPSGSLAGGIPAKVLKESCYPRPMDAAARLAFMRDFLRTFAEICSDGHQVSYAETAAGARIMIDTAWLGYEPDLDAASTQGTDPAEVIVLTDADSGGGKGAMVADVTGRTLRGPATRLSERLLNQLRRYGIRFYYESRDGQYARWE